MNRDCIYRNEAIDALWKALHKYEDKTEKQFIDADDLDVADWIQHRIFVQNMNDIDRQTILSLPSAQPTYTDEEIQKMQDLEQAEIEKAYQLGYEDGKKDAQPEDWMERNKECILQAGMEGREIEFRIGGRLFAIREKAQ